MVHSRRKPQTQQLVIPKGLVGPNDIAIVEIPRRYRRLPVIVAKPHIIAPRAEERAADYFIDGPKDAQSSRTRPKQVTPSSNSTAATPSTSSQQPAQNTSSAPPSQLQSATTTSVPQTSVQNAAPASTPAATNPSYQYPVMLPYATSSAMTYDGIIVPPYKSSGTSKFCPGSISTIKPTKVPTTFYTCESAPVSPCLDAASSTMQYSDAALKRKELMEKDNVRKSLEEFQEARRKFLNNANALAGRMRACYTKRDDDSSSSSDS